MGNEAERYNFIRHKSGLTAKAFAESLGLSKAMGYQISRGLLKPSRAVLERLPRTYHVNLHWFLTEKGPSGLESNTVEIELLKQGITAGPGREMEDYAKKRLFQIPHFHPEETSGSGIFVVAIGNSLVVERVDWDLASQTIVLYSANPIYKPRRFSRPELADIRIVGRVVACYHRV
jgi:transcriptional regulator with XRE-family HTH domain